MTIDNRTVAAVRELEAQRGALVDLLGSRAAEYCGQLASMSAERDALKARVDALEKEIADLKIQVAELA